MLTVYIRPAGQQTEVAYTEEIDSISWATNNNEGASFTASMPSLTAAITLNVVDSFLSGLQKGARVRIVSDSENTLPIYAYVIEVTPLDKKGVTEISCSGNFFAQSNNIFGTLMIEEDTWENTAAKYGLDMVEAHESHPAIPANVEKKEDIVMAVAWGYQTRRNVSRTPFTSGDGFYQNDGAGIFKNATVSDNDPYAPVYRIRPEQIIDYNIGPAQPPVTHIQTTTLGTPKSQPSMPVIAFRNYTEAEGSDITEYAQAFYIPEKSLSAVYVCHQKDDGSILEQSLTWTDGTVTPLPSDKKVSVLGIFSDSYITYELTNSSTGLYNVKAFKKDDGTAVQGLAMSIYKQEKEVFNDTAKIGITSSIYSDAGDTAYEYCWFSTVVGNYVAIMHTVSSNGPTYASYSAIHSPVDTARFINARVVKDSQNKDVVAAYYSRNESYTGSTYGADAVIFALVPDTSLGSVTRYNCGRYGEYSNGSVVDVWATHLIPTQQHPTRYLVEGPALVGEQPKFKTGMNQFDGAADYISVRDYGVSGRLACFEREQGYLVIVDSVNAESTGNALVPPAGYRLSRWTLRDKDNIATEIQSGSVEQWAGGYNIFYAQMTQDIVFIKAYEGERFYSAYVQISPVAFLSRGVGDPAVYLKIGEGASNPVQLPFKVGSITQSDKFTWNDDLGRVEIELAEFDVRKNSDGTWMTKSVQDLNRMAMTAYVQSYLTPEDEAAGKMTLLRVTGFDLEYSGVVSAKLRGIIVE